MASDEVEVAQDRSHYPNIGSSKAAPQLFKDGKQGWLKATDDSPNIRVTIIQSQQNPITKKWEYQVKDNEGVLVGNDGWVTQNELSKSNN